MNRTVNFRKILTVDSPWLSCGYPIPSKWLVVCIKQNDTDNDDILECSFVVYYVKCIEGLNYINCAEHTIVKQIEHMSFNPRDALLYSKSQEC